MTVIDNVGFNPAHYSAMSDNVAVLERLYRAKADVFGKAAATGRTPLHIAASCGSLKVVKFLCRVAKEAGYDPFSTDSEGKSPLWLASFYKHNHVCTFLHSVSTTSGHLCRDNINFLFRACVKTPKFAIELMKSPEYSHVSKFRGAGALWLNKIAELGEGEKFRANNKDFTLGYINMFGIELNVTPEPFMKHYIATCWKKFARRLAYQELFFYFFFSVLSTVLYLIHGAYWRAYSVDGAKLPLENPLCISMVVLLVVWYISLLLMLVLDLKMMWCKWKHHKGAWRHEKELLNLEKQFAHPFMVNMSLLLRDEEKELDSKGGAVGFLMGAKFPTFDFLVHFISLLLVSGYLALFFTNADVMDSSYFVIFGMSIMIALIWYSSFLVLRLIPQTGAFIVAIQKMVGAMVEFFILFLASYVPFAFIFWKTIFSWTSLSEELGADLTEINQTEAFYKVFRMAVTDYDFDTGANIGKAIDDEIWWDCIATGWVFLSNIMLLNLLIALMGSKFNGAYEKIIHYSLQNLLWWCHDIQMEMSPEQRAKFDEYLCTSKCSPYIYVEKSASLPPDSNSISQVGKAIDDLAMSMKFKMELLRRNPPKTSSSTSDTSSSTVTETDYQTETARNYA